MVGRIIELSVKHWLAVLALVAALLGWSVWSMKQTPLDAVPDLSDPQVIVFTDWMGRSPDLVEDQITYPLVRALQSTPGVRTVRGYSMFGMSFIYAIFDDGTDIYWARTRVLEQLGRVAQMLPPGVAPTLGPDATGVGWVYQYALEDDSGQLDLAELRELQDFTIRPALQAVPGVAEVASLGGFERQYQVVLDPQKLASLGVGIQDVMRAVRAANSEVGARVVEMSGREYLLRGRGYVRTLADIEQSAVALGPGGTPIRVRDVATVQFGPEIRRGAADLDGRGEVTGGIVVMRIGSNALEVIEGVEQRIAALSLPEGVRIVPTYDRSTLIEGSIDTLKEALLEEAIIVSLVSLLFLFHARSALISVIVLPAAVALAFIPMHYLGLTSNIMSLGGIAIAIGELVDATIVLVENAHVRLADAPPGSDRRAIIIGAAKEVGAPIFFSLLLIAVSFTPIFLLPGQSGRLFRPLAYTKTFAMFAAALLSITLAPILMVLLLRGRMRRQDEHPVTRWLVRLYQPVVRFVVRMRRAVVLAAFVLVAATVPLFLGMGSEFMPPLDEGSLLVMPTTFAGISIEEARRVLTSQNRILRSFPEVASVHGKTGRAETATDPAQLDMIETVVELKPRDQWPARDAVRWWSKRAPGWLKPALGWLWPERRPFTIEELQSELARAIETPGFQMAISPPIRTRIDMLTTGVRTPVGVKVLGSDLAEIERISIALEGLLREVPGTRSTFAERQTGREYLDIVPNREAIARYGLSVRDVHDVVEAAVGGMPVSTVIAGRARFGVNIRYASDFRSDPLALAQLLLVVPSSEPSLELFGGASGTGSSALGGPAMNARVDAGMNTRGSMGDGMGGMPQRGAPGAMGPSNAMTDPGGSTLGNPGMQSGSSLDSASGFGQRVATVPLGELAEVRVTTGPPMIKDEDGVLVGYVFADIDGNERDLGGWVNDAKRLVSERVALPPGYRLAWTGQYEFLAETNERLQYVVPLTLVLVVVLLYLSMRGWQQTALVLSSLPFAAAGSIWLLVALDYHLSTAVWVGIIAVAGLAAETGTVMIVYLDEAFARHSARGVLSANDIDEAVVEGAALRVRPLIMTVATTAIGLLPLVWAKGVGADVTARTAAPVIGGVIAALLLTLLVLPAAYASWRRHQLRRQSSAACAEAGGALVEDAG